MICIKCGGACLLCPADWPFQDDFLICQDCDTVYAIEHDKDKNSNPGQESSYSQSQPHGTLPREE